MTTSREASSPPFFVVGSVRSGTTLLRLILGHHSQICRCDEMEFVTGEIVPTDVEYSTVQYIHNLKLDRGFRLSGYHIREKLSYSEIARDFLRQRQTIDQKKIVGATVHHNFDELPDLWPDARFIYINRDPRDVSRSCVQLGWAGTAWFAANFWLNANDCWQRVCSRVPEESCITLSFEELVAQPTDTIKRICEFLEVEYEPAMLNIEADTTYSRPDPRSAKSWKELAPKDEIMQVESRVGVQRLIDNGYSPSGYPQLQNTISFRYRIRVADALMRARMRIQKYGLKLWLKGFVTRRMPFARLREAVQLEIDRIENSLMK